MTGISSDGKAHTAGYRVTWLHVSVFSLVQLVSNLVYRIGYPYAPFIAPALGLNLSEYAVFLLAMDLASIFCGVMILTFGKVSRPQIAYFQAVQALATLFLPVFVPAFIRLGIPLTGLVVLRFCTGIGNYMIGNLQRSIIGQYVDESRRARFLAVYEMCWNISSIAIGFLGSSIHLYGALTTFFILGIMSCVVLMIAYPWWPKELALDDSTPDEKESTEIQGLIQEDFGNKSSGSFDTGRTYGSLDGNGETKDTERSLGSPTTGSLWEVFSQNATVVFTSKILVSYFLFNFALTGATAAFNTNFGVWLHKDHGLNAVYVGACSSILGLGEMAGCLLTFRYSDRVGYKRGIYITGSIACLTLFAFSIWETTVANVVVGVALLVNYYAFGEYCWITGLTFVSTFTPSNCNKVVSITILMSFGSLGSLIGTAVAYPLYCVGGYSLPIAASSAFVFGCLCVFMVTTWKLRSR